MPGPGVIGAFTILSIPAIGEPELPEESPVLPCPTQVINRGYAEDRTQVQRITNVLKIAKYFMGKGVRVKIQNIDEPVTMSSLLSTEHSKLAVLLDLQCERGSYILKEASKNNFFDLLHFWLAFLGNATDNRVINEAGNETNGTRILSSEDPLLSELESLLILLNSQFTLVRSGSQQDQFLLQDVYKILPDQSLIFTPLQKWSPGQKYPESPKRDDFGGVTLQSATVMMKEDIWEYFMDPRYKHINSYTKKGYAMTERLATHLNFKLNVTPTWTWGYPRNVTSTGVVVYDGILGMLQRREMDLSSTGLLYKLKRLDIVDYSGDVGIYDPDLVPSDFHLFQHLKKFLGGQRFDGDDTQNLISKFGWEQIDHPPYSPDLVPSDFHLFLHLKKFLGGQRFDGDDTQNLISKFGWEQIDHPPTARIWLRHLKKFLGGQRFDGDDTQNLTSKFGSEQIDHPPYSPDLAPSDFHLLLYLKKFLGGQRFDGDEVKTAVREWFALQAGEFYNEGIERLLPRLDKCLNNGGDYVEKRNLTIRELAQDAGLALTTVLHILKNRLKMRKIASKWVPYDLTDMQKCQRYNASRTLLQRYEREGKVFLLRIITVDEICARSYEPQLKRQSDEWRHHCDVRFELTTSVPQESRSHRLHGTLSDVARWREERGCITSTRRGWARSCYLTHQSKQARLVCRSSTRVCVRICVSIRRPEFECSGPQLEGPEFECSGPQLEGPEFEYSELSLKAGVRDTVNSSD
ncbi:hypothetical protein ANN_07414 [Periplaneta americana]|uniref:Ionotropic receptor 75a N-terminal domain-containing protein n=1 Tax=Periplaneta americana TaxID=6978 RepID=A0ABQ8SZW6_PERAM|nr:hypothetical protein ANN_07414 [Periplaneta americana]